MVMFMPSVPLYGRIHQLSGLLKLANFKDPGRKPRLQLGNINLSGLAK
jgi:hypothetical protein